jgi:acyl CoA:acetate/3-ketoacid CoA transferase alpha subunit
MSHANDRLFDHQQAREWKLKKSRIKKDKRMPLSEAIAELVDDGDSLIETGFAYVRGPMAAYWEIGRQKKKDLVGIFTPGGMNSAWHEFGGMEGCHVAYVGVEMRGLISPFRRGVEAGTLKIYSEWSHGGLALGLRAAEQGVNYMACKSMLGTDIMKTNPYIKEAQDPWTGEPVCLVPAVYPDVAILHVHHADKYGNGRIWGPAVNDTAIVAAARKVIVTCERIVDTEDIRANPYQVVVPHYVVDAVCESPLGAWPGEMPGLYYFDRRLQERIVRVDWKTAEGTKAWYEEYILGTKDQFEMLSLAAEEEGMHPLEYVKELENLACDSAFCSLGSWGIGGGRDWKYEEVAKRAI